MDELNPTVREQEIYGEEMELGLRWSSPSELSAVPVCGTLWMQRLSQNRACTQPRPEHGHMHRPPDAARLRLCGHAPLTTIPPYSAPKLVAEHPAAGFAHNNMEVQFCSKTGNLNAEISLHHFRGEHRLGTAQ